MNLFRGRRLWIDDFLFQSTNLFSLVRQFLLAVLLLQHRHLLPLGDAEQRLGAVREAVPRTEAPPAVGTDGEALLWKWSARSINMIVISVVEVKTSCGVGQVHAAPPEPVLIHRPGIWKTQ